MTKYSIIPAFLSVSILIVLASCRSVPNNASSGTSVIAGLVLEGPISPVQRPGELNEAPLAGAPITIVSDYTYDPPIHVVSDSAGRFSVTVASGTYSVTPNSFPNQALPRPMEASTVQVPANTTVFDTLHYDTGIR